MELPKEFLGKMQGLLQDEYDDFLQSYENVKTQGLRVNPLKVSVEEFMKLSPFSLDPIPWVKEGFFYKEEERPGKHPYHEAGLYYIQEPSAMAVGELVGAKPGEKVLDLCAAPGGKTTHLASSMNQEGFLLANEIYPARAKALAQNVERLGIKNAVVTNESPERLAARFPAYFDRILVDAPCSGEGMFRKDPQACLEWSLENVLACANRQLEIMMHAATMLKAGGRLVYSTCTFSPEENEGVISQFLKRAPEFEIENIHGFEGFSSGRSEWVEEAAKQIGQTLRLWPHQIKGEGHFIAVLRKTAGHVIEKRNFIAAIKNEKQLNDYFQFAHDTLKQTPRGKFLLFGEQLYIVPDEMLALDKLKVVRPGWHLGTIKKNRFEPSHALALALTEKDVNHYVNLPSDSREILTYLKGDSLHEGAKGWNLVCVDGFSIGWGKHSNGILKNHYPKGLRWL